MMVLGQEPRQATSNLGHLNKPSIQVNCILASLLALVLTVLLDIRDESMSEFYYVCLVTSVSVVEG